MPLCEGTKDAPRQFLHALRALGDAQAAQIDRRCGVADGASTTGRSMEVVTAEEAA